MMCTTTVLVMCMVALGAWGETDGPNSAVDEFLRERMETYLDRGYDRLEVDDLEEMEFPHGVTVKVKDAYLENITTFYRDGDITVMHGDREGSTVFWIPLRLAVLRAGVEMSYTAGFLANTKRIKSSVERVTFLLRVSTLKTKGEGEETACSGNVDGLSFRDLSGYDVDFGDKLMDRLESGLVTWCLNTLQPIILRLVNFAIKEAQVQYGMYLPSQGELICRLFGNFSAPV